MNGIMAIVPGLLAPEPQGLQTNVVGLPLWVWLLALIVVIILLILLLRPAPSAEKPVVEEVPPPPVEKPASTPPLAPFTDEVDSLDDLTIIEGIGPKISGVLREAGINTFQRLADSTPEQLAQILRAAGIQLFDASSWPEQASLVTTAKWTELKALQEKLVAGRKE